MDPGGQGLCRRLQCGWLFIGDQHIDAETATGAGYGYCSEKERHLFDMIVETPGELLLSAN
jgi:phosphoglycolate phosphatase-like HAD superfamily hydrolase